MTAEADRSWHRPDAATLKARARRALKAIRDRGLRGFRWLSEHLPFRHGFSSLTRRIVVLNLIGLAILVSGILYLNQFRAGLIDAKVQSLLTQGEIIARAIAASAGVDTNEVQLDPEKLLEQEQGPGGRRRRRVVQLAGIRHRPRARRAHPASVGEADGKPRPHL